MAYEVVTVRPDLRRPAAELLAGRMNRDVATTERYLEWRFERAPHPQAAALWLALEGGRVVGMRGCYPTLWRLPGTEAPVVLPCFCDTAVAADHASRGVFGAIMATALEQLRDHGHCYVLNLSATPVTLLDSLASGWRAVGRPTVLRRMPLPLRIRSRAAAVPGLRRAYHRLHAEPAQAAGYEPFAALDTAAATETVTAPDVVAALAAQPSGGRRIREACDGPYLEWLLAHPAQRQRVVVSRAAGRLTACLLLRGATDLSRVVVAAWYAESPRELAELATDVAHAGRWPELDVWNGSGDEKELEPFLRAGFVGGAPARGAALLIRSTAVVPPDVWRLGGTDLLAADAWRVRLLQSPLWLVPSTDETELDVEPARATGAIAERLGHDAFPSSIRGSPDAAAARSR